MKTKPHLLGCLPLLAIFMAFPPQVSSQMGTEKEENTLNGFVGDNLIVPIKDYQNALIQISNKQVVIDGYWEFKDETGQVLENPIILSQPGGVTDKLLLALRRPGSAEVAVTENGEMTVYNVEVEARFEENNIEKELESAIKKFVNDPDLKVTVLPPQAALVGANLNRAFGEETASEILAPRGETAGTATEDIAGADDFRPTIVLEGEVANDLVAAKAENIARAYTSNVINLISIRNPLQIKINVKVIQVTQNRDSNIGLQHRGASVDVDGNPINDGLGLIFTSTAPFFETTDDVPIFGDLFNAIGDGRTSTTYNTQVNLRDIGLEAEILQEPTLTVMNGQPAEFLVGQSVFVPTGFTIDEGIVTQLFDERELGVSLRITPLIQEEEVFRPDAETGGIPVSSINIQKSQRERGEEGDNNDFTTTIDENGTVRLFVQPTISSISGFDDNGFVQIDTNRVETRVAIRHNESLVIGGLFDREERNTTENVPFLSQIPVLGELFKNRVRDNEKTELIFVLTPQVIGIEDLNEKGRIVGREKRTNEILLEEGLQTKPTRISANEIRVRPTDDVMFISTSDQEPIRLDQATYERMLEESKQQMDGQSNAENENENEDAPNVVDEETTATPSPGFQEGGIPLTPRSDGGQ